MADKNRSKAIVPASDGDATDAESQEKRVDPTEACLDGGFPIVGIGASAGGLAAFEAFFSSMPPLVEPGMAFVLVQHLAPDHKSMLTDLIRKYTRMEVFEVEDGMRVRPNCAYIIPPNCDMAFLNGALHLLEPTVPRGRRMPIDYFFRSLAQDQHERAICIVLSGTGSDGALGVRAIKGEGGLVIVQDPDSTEHDGMPCSAITTGMVDYVLPVEEMPRQLLDYVTHVFGKLRRATPTQMPKSDSAPQKIFLLLRAQTGNDFSQYKPSTIYRRIERRMAIHQIEKIGDYVSHLQQSPAAVEDLFRDLLIGVTSFFRDPDAFAVLERQAIPRLFANKHPGAVIRIWVPCCSTGEEAYSIAILLHEYMVAQKLSHAVQVFATDIDKRAIAAARTGAFPASIAADISPERLARAFAIEADGATYRINKVIRNMLIFSEQNVIKDPPFSKLDLISCRNFLIYLSRDLQKKVVSLFRYALNPGGALFLGSSENVGDHDNLFVPLDRKARIFLSKQDAYGTQRMNGDRLFFPLVAATAATASWAVTKAGIPTKPSLREITEQGVLQHEGLAGALVNKQGDVLYLHGRTGAYLEPTPGESGVNNILKMAREGLKRELTTALHRCVEKNEPVHYSGLRVRTNDHFVAVNLSVYPIEGDHFATHGSPMYLVILERLYQPQPVVADRALAGGDLSSEGDARIDALKQQLRAKEEYLQAANEELETANEELSSSNEEMQSVNEELESTNEELETSREELQSINEELATVNTELQAKVADLSRLNDDINNMLTSTGIATVFVDLYQRILRFTPTATELINLIASDVGRPVAHLVPNLVGYDSLASDVQTVLNSLVHKEMEVETKEGKWYIMRIQPYRTSDNVIEGAVITFVDITEMKMAKEASAVSELRFRRLFETAKNGIIVLDAETGMVEDANQFLIDLLGYTKEQLLKKAIWDLGLFKDVVANKKRFSELQEQEYVRYDELPLETADGRLITAEFISRLYTIRRRKLIQCDIRESSIMGRRRERS